MAFLNYTGATQVSVALLTNIKTMLTELYTLVAVDLAYLAVAKTANYTVLTTDLTGLVCFTNTGTAADIILTLPAGVADYTCDVLVTVNKYIRLNTNGTEKFRYLGTQSAAGGYLRSDVIGTKFRLKFTTEWVITQLTGILKYDE